MDTKRWGWWLGGQVGGRVSWMDIKRGLVWGLPAPSPHLVETADAACRQGGPDPAPAPVSPTVR